jgi:hypothetical protein
MDKQTICAMLRVWINQRPGLDFANYGDIKTYRSALRSITKDRAEALQLLRAVELRDSITAEMMVAAFPRAYSGRLRLEKREKDGKWVLDYCTGQYWPTEYRRAACAVLASVLWDWVRSTSMPQPTYKQHGSADDRPMRTEELYDGISAGDWLRRYFRREFGRGIASRWFS